MPRSLPSDFRAFALRAGEAGIVDRLHGGVERGAEVADIVGHDHGRLVRELVMKFWRRNSVGSTFNCRAAVSIIRSTR